MAAGVHNLNLEQGATFRRIFTWKVKDTQTGVVTVTDLTGCTANMQMRATSASATALVNISTTSNTNGSIVLGGALGTITVHVVSSFIPSGTGVWDLEITHPNGDVTRLLKGTYSTSDEVTK